MKKKQEKKVVQSLSCAKIHERIEKLFGDIYVCEQPDHALQTLLFRVVELIAIHHAFDMVGEHEEEFHAKKG